MKKAFIITLTGPSACGKGVITKAIIELQEYWNERGIEFNPFMMQKDVTRSYRFNEAREIINGRQNNIDVNSVSEIPLRDDFVYRTYGDEYAVSSDDLTQALNDGKSPIVVINDIRVVEELKAFYPNQVLSLFIFRHIIPDIEQHKKASAERGGVSERKTLSRYEKAVALYRVFIENIQIFDRVILNVREGDIELAKLQAKNVINGVIEGKISLNKKIVKGPKLFIVSGNAASGKDDIIKAAKSYGKKQADILIKSTSRQEENGDVGEIVCKYIPKKEKIIEYQNVYFDLVKEVEYKYKELVRQISISGNFALDRENFFFQSNLYLQYQQYMSTNNLVDGKDITFIEFAKTQLFLRKNSDLRDILRPIDMFWRDLKAEQEKRKTSTGELLKSDYLTILNEWFELNDQETYIDLDKIRENTREQQQLEQSKIIDKKENKSWFLTYEDKEYIFYENNELYGEPIKYGFEIGNYVREWREKRRTKHLVLTASLPNMFRICKEQFGEKNVITAFTYSQISQKEHEKNSDVAIGKAKSKEYNDIIRYAEHIAEFDYALIYAETSLTNLSGNQKDELVDQMFRLFRVYNK